VTRVKEGRRRRAQLIFWSGVLVTAAVFTTVVLVGANRPADPQLLSFPEISFRIQGGPGGAAAAAEHCALLADTPEQHARGLMERTDLGEYDGMLFRFAADTSGSFYMKDTVIPLSIAWFNHEGFFVSATDMEPCPTDVGCPTYAAAGPYRYALEVPKGGLPALGIGPGAQLVVTGGGCG
jgi:uncharacterized membrane protein (UPF0127 family)